MTVKIRKGRFKIKFWLPTCTAVSLIRRAAKREIEKRGFGIRFGRRQKRAIKKAVVQLKKDFGKLELLSVSTSGNFKIFITL